MAGIAAALRLDLEKDRILIAVGEHLNDPLAVTRNGALPPQFLSRAAPEMRFSRFEGEPKCFAVHIGEHQYRPVARVDNYRRDQALFVEDGRKDSAFFTALGNHSEKPLEGARTSSMNRAWSTGFDLNSPVN